MSSQVTLLHCVRHAQGYHNLGAEFFNLKDPALTPLGEEQCAKLRHDQFRDQSKIRLVASSPLVRAIHTACLVFQPTLETQTLLAIPAAQEIFDYGSDTGKEPEFLKEMTDKHGWPVDLSLVGRGWNDKDLDGPNSPVSPACAARARTVRRILREKAKELSKETDEEIHIALVAHGSFMHYLTNEWENSTRGCGTAWRNCEARAYNFMDFEDDGAWLVETADSREFRGVEGPPASLERQKELYEEAMDGWVGQGLPDLRSVATASAKEPRSKL
ncbi:hypothetical protein CEP51_014176 [Fusarium floridanum]|uniref:Uncharacterized protein n=1 Tax=Fusarium floridanum TaxID=1325733 RepID=A0A428PXJ8_9HYPO|nr:hypothetical protein CEP51_014176 [Fusarium floridanum]